MSREEALSCSFCGKSQRQVRKLIAGPTVYICDECIGVCNEIIAEEITEESRRPFALDAHASPLVGIARHLAETCEGAVELPRFVAERARAVAEEVEAAVAAIAGPRAVLVKYARSVAVDARHLAEACDAAELPVPIAERARSLLAGIEAVVGRQYAGESLSCSFCGKSLREVRKLIPGPMVYICDECILLCNQIVAEETAGKPRRPSASEVHPDTLLQIARQLAETCDEAVERPRSIAERARALAEEIEAVIPAEEEPRGALAQAARSVAVDARQVAMACDVAELPRPIAERARALFVEIEALLGSNPR